MEIQWAHKDINAYHKFFIGWTVLILLGLGFYFYASSPNHKGLALGLLFLFISALTIDTLLQDNVRNYHES